MTEDVRFDWQRKRRAGVPEVVLAESKQVDQLETIARQVLARGERVLMTRLHKDQAAALAQRLSSDFHHHAESRTAIVGQSGIQTAASGREPRIAIVAAGTSDVPVVAEIEQCLDFLGEPSRRYVDVGVAGLWRLTELAEELSTYRLLIAVAGMEGAIFSVLAGLVPVPVIAVPVSVGYGVSAGGQVALQSALSSCVPGIAVVNIDNGFGAAALACKLLATSNDSAAASTSRQTLADDGASGTVTDL